MLNKIIRNTLAIVGGLVIGSIVNMGLINCSGYFISPPDGVDLSTADGLKEGLHLFELKHFIFPFLAHALGTLVGAFVATILAVNHKFKFALTIGIFFLIGGISASVILPSPVWFIVIDLVFGYIPMAILGFKLVRIKPKEEN